MSFSSEVDSVLHIKSYFWATQKSATQLKKI